MYNHVKHLHFSHFIQEDSKKERQRKKKIAYFSLYRLYLFLLIPICAVVISAFITSQKIRETDSAAEGESEGLGGGPDEDTSSAQAEWHLLCNLVS